MASRPRKGQNPNPKKGKTLMKLINKSESESDESEHELSYYLNDRVKLMKEVLKIIKPKKIRSMAPKWMRSLETEEIHSMLFEELLGISNKRLKHVFNGEKQKVDADSSSTDPEDEEKPVDVISLDDITDDEFVINLDSDEGSVDRSKSSGKAKIKEESKRKKIKKEKRDHSDKKKTKQPDKKNDEENLMSVLELLELQARARAIKSQLALESKKKAELQDKNEKNDVREEKSDNEEAVIIESPKNIEIIITSSESENEDSNKSKNDESQSTVKESDQHSLSRHETVNKNSDDRTEGTESVSNNEENDKSDGNQKNNEELDKESVDKSEEPSTSGIKEINIEKDKNDENSISEEISQKNDENSNSEAISQSKSPPEISDTTNSEEPIVTQEEVDSDKTHDKTERKKIRIFRKRQSSTTEESKSEEINEAVSPKQNETDDVELDTGEQSRTETKIDAVEENDGILINVDQSEIEYISSD